MMRIDRCVCFDVTFSRLRELAAQVGAGTIEELQAHVEFGRRCMLCHPYVRRMLQTGETVFSEPLEE